MYGFHILRRKKYRLLFVQHRIKSLQGLVHFRPNHAGRVGGKGRFVRLGLFRLAVQFPEFGHYPDHRARIHPARAVEGSEQGRVVPDEHLFSAGTRREEEPATARQHTALRHHMRHREAQFAQFFHCFFLRTDDLARFDFGLDTRLFIRRISG